LLPLAAAWPQMPCGAHGRAVTLNNLEGWARLGGDVQQQRTIDGTERLLAASI